MRAAYVAGFDQAGKIDGLAVHKRPSRLAASPLLSFLAAALKRVRRGSPIK